MSECAFPKCHAKPTTRNRAGKDTCAYHQPVVIADSASWQGEGSHHTKEPDGE